LRPDSAPRLQAISDYKRILRPGRRAIVDIAVLYPTTQMMLDMTGFPVGQIAFCAQGRAHFDYDLVDENMVAGTCSGATGFFCTLAARFSASPP
jgi:hypothetical protein